MAEKVVRVPSPNRPPSSRVDFFCYKNNGDVVRHHPGRSKMQDMKPHCMPLGSLCFHMADAAQLGVGASLHAQPPRMVQWPNSPLADLSSSGDPAVHLLATREDMERLSVYDIQSVNWRATRERLRVLRLHDHTVDWSDGFHFPGWVWLDSTGVLRDVVNDGVVGVELEVADCKKCVVVHSVRGGFRLSEHPVTSKIVIRPTPPRYDP